MKTNLITIIVALGIFCPSQAQNFGLCGYNDISNKYTESSTWSNSSNTWLEYRTPGHWIPDQNTPIKTILVNWIVCRDDNGQNGWQDTIAFWDQVHLMFDTINYWYSHSLPKGYSLICEPSYNHVYDTRIRFELNDIIFINNTSFNESCIPDDILDYVFANYPESRNVLNHVFTMPPEPCSNNNVWGRYSIYNGNACIHTYYSMWSRWYVVWGDHIEHIAHEYGHAVGQNHTYDSEERCITHYDFLDDVFGTCSEESCEPCNSPYNCEDDYVCYLTKQCFWDEQTPPFPLMSGNNINSRYISPKSAGRMHRALSLYDNTFEVNNRPMHNYVKEKYSYNVPLIISSNETWDFAIKMYQDIVIESGNTLTIKGEVKMPIDGKIIVKQGAKLVLDSAILTTAHSEPWAGIEVWGNSSAHQYMVNNNYLQGYLEMKNGATIENAKCAVQLWKPNYISTTGGIIHATDAVFRNNATSLIALNYNNYNPNTGYDMDYNSYFTDCEFVVDGNYLGNETFYTHVELGYNRGIDFTGCDFSVSSNANGVSANNAGITAYSAGFGVKSSCMDPNTYPCPTNSIKGCTFTGFDTGILSINEGNNTNTLSVKDAVFTNNHTGIHALNIGYAAIVGNEFNIGCDTDCTYGIYIDGATSFCIEENLFKPAYNIKCTRYGVGVFNSPSINDIYLNTFNNLTYGNLSYGVNYNVNGGLTYSCNENSGNKIDFCVLKDNGFGMPKPIQGSSTSPAGNSFGGSQYHIYNDGDWLMDYHYNSSATGQTPNSSKLYRVNAYPTTSSNSCASHYGGGGVLKSPEEKAALAEIYKTSQDNHERYLAAGDIIRSNLNDSVANPTELRQWLANMNEIASDRMIVASYIHEGDFTNAFALANTLPNKYNLQGDELSDHNDYMTLLNLYRALYNSNRTVRELTESEKETVANIAENGHGASKLMATGIIMETSDRTAVSYICPTLSREDGDKNEDTSGNKDIDYVDELFVGLSPIPASTWVSVDYKLPANYAKATMTIMSSYGAKIMDVELLGDRGTTTVDLRDLSNGVYSYIVRCGDKIFTGKLVVTK